MQYAIQNSALEKEAEKVRHGAKRKEAEQCPMEEEDKASKENVGDNIMMYDTSREHLIGGRFNEGYHGNSNLRTPTAQFAERSNGPDINYWAY